MNTWILKQPEITPGAKVIVGLGDSFTQGVGAWSDETYEKHGYRIDALSIPNEIKDEMVDNSWVSQICRNHLTDYLPINLGAMGTGNRSSVKELYLHPEIKLQNASEVIVVLLLSGIERFDFINKDFPIESHFYTMWPNPWDKNTTNKKLWQAYAESVWSDKFVLVECLLNIMEAEMICQANGWNLVVASAFDQRITMDNYLEKLGDERRDLIYTIPWSKFLYPQGCNSFMQLLLRLDGNEEMAPGSYYEHYSALKKSTKHITPCVHPSIEGHRIMAEELYNFMVQKRYVQPKV